MGTAIQFDATQVDPNPVYEALPAGDYLAVVTRCEVKQTKAGNGQYLELEFDVQSDPYRGRKLFDRINLWNPNPKTVEIAQRQLSALCHATGVLQLADSDQLLGQTAIVSINAENDPQYGVRNKVKGYKAPEGMRQPAQAPRASAPAPMTQPPRAAAPAPARAPWAA